MKELGYYNGKVGELSEMTVPMNDRAGFFGDGVYEAAVARNGIIFAERDHIDRFFRSAAKLRMELPYTKEELHEILQGLVDRMDPGDLFIYWQASRGTASRNHLFPGEDVKPNLWVTLSLKEVKKPGEPIQLITLEDTRFLHCDIKTLNLIPAVMASQAAAEAGCGEAVLHRGDRVTECAHSNVSILKDGVLMTAPTDNLILPGITRAHLIRICKDLGGPVREEPFTLDDLRSADEILVTSTTKFCAAADRLDGQPAGGKDPELARKLAEALYDEFRRETHDI